VRIVTEALPAPINVLELDDDYQRQTLGGEPLQSLLDDYRRRAGDDALAAAMGGQTTTCKTSVRRHPRVKRVGGAR